MAGTTALPPAYPVSIPFSLANWRKSRARSCSRCTFSGCASICRSASSAAPALAGEMPTL